MKKLLVALALMASSTAMAAKYETVTVCNGGESGDVCHQVTYRVRPASKPEVVKETCIVGEIEGPCPTKYGVPGWLKRLNEAFARAGFTAPEQDDLYRN